MKRFLLGIAVVAVIGSAYGIYCVHRYVTVSIPNAYAMDWSSAMVIEYLETHDGSWPRSWEDLRVPYENLAAPQNYPWSFDEIQERVTIDWSVDVDSLMALNQTRTRRTQRIISLSAGDDSDWQAVEPNRRIFNYLRETGAPAHETD